jgi:small-conductance mechanosensitive channel
MENLDQIFDPQSATFWNLLLALVALVGSVFVARLVRRRSRAWMLDNDLDESATSLIARMAGWAVIFIGAVLALSIMGVDMVPVVLLIVLVLAFAVFSGRSLLENWAAGLLLQARGPYAVGDRIDTEGYSGFVQETNARSVILRAPDGEIVHVPNIDVLTSPLLNRTGVEGIRRSSVSFGVAADSDFSLVERILIDTARSTEGVMIEERPPTAWISNIGDTTVDVELRFWHLYSDRHTIRSDITDGALRSLSQAGVRLPFPTQEIVVSGTLG